MASTSRNSNAAREERVDEPRREGSSAGDGVVRKVVFLAGPRYGLWLFASSSCRSLSARPLELVLHLVR